MNDFQITECIFHGSYSSELKHCPTCERLGYYATTLSEPAIVADASYTRREVIESIQSGGKGEKSLQPKKPSPLEQAFIKEWTATGLPMPVAEYRFHTKRKWRFDFCFIEKKLAIELDGKPYGGRHTRGAGFIADLEKLNAAIELGYFVLRYHQVTEEAIAQIIRVYEAL